MSEDKKDKLHTLYKEDGKEVKVNSDSLTHALSIGWSEKKPKKENKGA